MYNAKVASVAQRYSTETTVISPTAAFSTNLPFKLKCARVWRLHLSPYPTCKLSRHRNYGTLWHQTCLATICHYRAEECWQFHTTEEELDWAVTKHRRSLGVWLRSAFHAKQHSQPQARVHPHSRLQVDKNTPLFFSISFSLPNLLYSCDIFCGTGMQN